ncbi:MAG TPA: AMP-binding protein, partial [Rhizomicrobium sp.]|nr:AMP-binding protein [Rhizomicrobium sp.]
MHIYERLGSVAAIPRLHAQERPDAIALDFNGRLTTYAELDARSNRVAQGLIGLGQHPGARVGYLGKNSDCYFEVLFGAFKARAVIVGVNWRLAPPEIAYVLNDADCEVLFVGKEYYGTIEKIREDCPKLEHVIAIEGEHHLWPAYEPWRDARPDKDPMLHVAPGDDVIQLYTSGTTGHPKGVQLTSANYMAILKSATDMGLASYTPDDVVLIAMPIFHVAGVNIGVLTLAHGATGIVLGDIDPQEILRLIEAKRISYAFLVPAVILFLTQQPNVRKIDFSSLKNISYGASPIAQDLLLNAQAI